MALNNMPAIDLEPHRKLGAADRLIDPPLRGRKLKSKLTHRAARAAIDRREGRGRESI
jgi:hypothetical protein